MNIRQAILPRNQELVATILAEGNQLATHSWDHPHFNGDSTRFPAIPALTTTQVAAEIGNARTLQKQLTISTQRPTGYDSKLFRFPYLESSTAATTYLASQGMIAVPSDVDPLDWEPTTTISDATLVSEVMNGAPANITLGTDAVTAVFNGAIVDLHDGTDALRRGHPTYLPLLLTALSNAGYATAIIPSA